MSTMDYLLFGLAIVGGGWLFWNILAPLIDWVLRMIGYGIFEAWITPWAKAKSWRVACRHLLITIPKQCFSESGNLGCVWGSEVSAKGKSWRPYFHYRKS